MSIILPHPGAAGAKRGKTQQKHYFSAAFNAVEEADNSISLTPSGLACWEKFCKKISQSVTLLTAADQTAHATPFHKRRDLMAHFGGHLRVQYPLRQHFGVR
ncbi:Uncharacterised protein [Serratia grimesii]|nr:Uncharacterised protein [Serratia grimesii]CAI1154380.1 Uncharacterised protein [Serratia grimesii]CAI2525487.1 Uncharacterised protein [Serratia grimesii]CAI2786752.1 Uncharacterised protein [Serratia grimesii]CUW23663.1 Uncharacterised protein [Serratia grimesii]